MRTMLSLLLAGSCALSTGLQASSQTASPDNKPPQAAAAGSGEKPAGRPQPSLPEKETAPAAPPGVHFPDGTKLFVKFIEPIKDFSMDAVPYRNSEIDAWKKKEPIHEADHYKQLVKEFEKDSRFRLVRSAAESDAVFLLLTYTKQTWRLSGQYLAIAVTADEYKKHVEELNPIRGIAHITAMLPAAVWTSEKGSHSFVTGASNPADLARAFCQYTK